jgi:hypothetical protein
VVAVLPIAATAFTFCLDDLAADVVVAMRSDRGPREGDRDRVHRDLGRDCSAERRNGCRPAYEAWVFERRSASEIREDVSDIERGKVRTYIARPGS